jgi:hypothetical protein
VALLLGSMVMGVVVIALAAIRIGRVASWRALARVAAATGSLQACVEFIRYCERS